MPNWCMNDLTITAPTSVIKEIVDSQLSLQKLFPCPQELLDTTAPAKSNAPEKYSSNIEKYGHGDWYSWQVSNWGTKWDIGPIELSMDLNTSDNHDGTHTLTAGFDSAWGPPAEAMRKLHEKYKDQNIEIRLEYFESGCCFLGVAHTSEGYFFDESADYTDADDLQSWVDELDHNLASYEVDYLREREEEERQYKIEQEAKDNLINTSKKVEKKSSKTSIKKSSIKNKKAVKKPAKNKPTKKPTKKLVKKTKAKKKSKKSTNKNITL